MSAISDAIELLRESEWADETSLIEDARAELAALRVENERLTARLKAVDALRRRWMENSALLTRAGGEMNATLSRDILSYAKELAAALRGEGQ